ncbi:hypothetical protein GF412_00140 [Candidatus Micrarchaeota archaeon]|nr:hypothetical protein [Candidatus Micrarchaeota archaeon]MBD3417384.1 hypothetical protein [Candidatus Micrarchaeota archaeon]
MKKMLMLLLLLPLCFAADGDMEWLTFALIAAFSAFGILVVLYLFSYLVDSRQMRLVATGELYQVGAAMLLIVLFVALQANFDTIISGPLSGTFSTEDFEPTSLIGAAKSVSNGISEYQWEELKKLNNKVAVPLGSMASLSATCSFLGTTFTAPGCIGIQVPSSSITFAMNAMVSSLLVQNSQIMLLNLAQNFFFPVLFPLGIFLRCFQFSRGAGGFLMAIAVAFYFVYPAAILVTKGMVDMVEMPDPSYPSISAPTEEMDWASFEVEGDCNPFDLNPYYTTRQVNNVLDPDMIDPILYYFFVGGLFTTMINIIVALSTVRGLSSLLGAEVDVSALARIS